MTFDTLQIVPCNYVDLIERNTYRAHRENLIYYPNPKSYPWSNAPGFVTLN